LKSKRPNPYEPPKAVLADRDASPRREPRPAFVSIGIMLLIANLLLEMFVNTALFFEVTKASGPPFRLLSMMLGVLFIFGGLIIAIAQRMNWARLAYVGMFLLMLTLPLLYRHLIDVPLQDAFARLPYVLALFVQAGGLIFLFTPTSNEWFRKPAD
jgi:hypothetical protein